MHRSACVPDEISAIRAQLRLKRMVTEETMAKIDGLSREFADSPDVQVLRGEALELRGDEGDLDGARDAYRRALALQPDHFEAERRLRSLQ